MSAAEALRSTMKGKHSALELVENERLFFLGRDEDEPKRADSIEDIPNTGLGRINMLNYNRSMIGPQAVPSIIKWGNFACVDLDGDGTNEVLVDNGISVQAVLYYAGGEVYLTHIYSKFSPYTVYENGVWETASGAFDRQFYRLYPAKGAVYVEDIAYEWVWEENPDASIYMIMNKEVSKDEHDAYVKELIGGTTSVEWHEFTEENIDKYVVD